MNAGFLLVDKPSGPTSHDVINSVRRAISLKRVGHTGTLDPFAEGLLLVLVGPATRLARYLHGLDKTYTATMRLGTATDTDDATGEVTETAPATSGSLKEEQIQAALRQWTGPQMQTPPIYSSKKIEGIPAHKRARRGESFSLEPVAVTVYELELLHHEGDDVRFRTRVSSGTYIRALARDIGKGLGVPAHLRKLRRTHIGTFSVEDAVAVSDISRAGIRPPLKLLSHLEMLEVTESDVQRLRNGLTMPVREPVPGVVALISGHSLVAVGEYVDGSIQPRVVLP